MEHLIARRATNRRYGMMQRKETLLLHRAIRDMSDPFKDPNFKKIYRLSPLLAMEIVNEIKEFYPKSTYGSSIPAHIKFLAALHFYSQGSYQKPDGRDSIISLSQASVSRVITQTTDILNRPDILRKWIQFPSENKIPQTIERNYRKFKLSGVLGFIDGTHIIIRKPVVHEELYVNRKGQHSLNVQVVCDSDLKILNILAKYPGSTHDAFIWKASSVREKLQATGTSCWLLGDSGYPLEPWLLTPVLNAPENSRVAKYTQMHILARNSIERLFGVWKNRFRCLHKHRTLEYAPTKAGRIVNACAVLHNICIKNNEWLEEEGEEAQEVVEDHPIIERPDTHDLDLLQRGQTVRDTLINRL